MVLDVPEVIIASLSALGGVYLGYWLHFKAEARSKAKECYFTYIVPLTNSLEDLLTALKAWSIIVEKYKAKSENELDERQKREIELANMNADLHALKFMNFLNVFNASPARLVLRKISSKIESKLAEISQVLTTTMEHPELQAPRKTILAPIRFPLIPDMLEEMIKLSEDLDKITLTNFIKTYRDILGSS